MGIALLLLFAPVLVLFQNCTKSFRYQDFESLGTNLNLARQGGEGYGGKVYAHHGECAPDRIGLKSVLRETGQGAWEILRENCSDLEEPRAVETSNLQPSLYDPGVLLKSGFVFDAVPFIPSERKLTTAFCYTEDRRTEVTVWYDARTLDELPDPRLAERLYGQVVFPDGHRSEILDIQRPEIFTDKLVYVSSPESTAFELVETRDGRRSKARLSVAGADVVLDLTCHAQAAPKFLEADRGYYLRLSPGLAAGGSHYAVMTHDTKAQQDTLKRIDGSDPLVSQNSTVGWDAGYASFGGRVYQMRKKNDGKICFGPATDPRAPCEIDVLEKVDSNEYSMLYAGLIGRGRSAARALALVTQWMQEKSTKDLTEQIRRYHEACGAQAPFPRHLHWKSLSYRLEDSAEILMYVNKPDVHRLLKEEVLRASRALMADLPENPFDTPLRKCRKSDFIMPAIVFSALSAAHLATGDPGIRNFIVGKKTHFQREIAELKSRPIERWPLLDLGQALKLLVLGDLYGMPVFDLSYMKEILNHLLDSQVLTAEQARAGASALPYGSFKTGPRDENGKSLVARSQVHALIETHHLLVRRKICAQADWGPVCERIRRAPVAYIVSLHNRQVEKAPVTSEEYLVFPRVLGFAYATGLKKTDRVQSGFRPDQQVSVQQLEKTALESNLKYTGRSQPTILANLMMAARLAEILSE